MGYFTRKNKHNNALKEARNAEERADYKMKHKHSKVANVLEEPGKFRYTNIDRIKKETDEEMEKIADKYDINVSQLKRDLKNEDMETSKLVDAAKELKKIVESQMNSKNNEVTITVPQALAKVLIIIINIALFFIVTFIAISSTLVVLGSSALGASNTGAISSLFNWILSGSWMYSLKSPSNMKYTNNPMRKNKN
jgi:sugar-specific transcriptional regulator TrmB